VPFKFRRGEKGSETLEEKRREESRGEERPM
jgi:hypothetical protein